MSTTDKVTEVLTSEPQTVAQIAEAVEASTDSVRKALKAMVEAGEVELVEGEAPNDPNRFRTPKRTRANHGYSRNSKDGGEDTKAADIRDWAVLTFIDENGPSTKAELAEGLGITKRAVSHAVWRLMGKPNKGTTSAPVILEQVTRGTYARVEDEAEVEAEAS